MDTFRLPRAEIEAKILLVDGDEITGRVFIPQFGPSGAPGRLVDRLNDEQEPFVPVSTANGPMLVNTERILTVRVQEDQDPEDKNAMEVIAVHFRMAGGATVAGRVGYSMPAERSRLLDYLNAGPCFLKIEQDHGVVLVQRRFISSVRLSG